MSVHLAIAAYRCLIAGIPSNTLDIKILWYPDSNIDEIRQRIREEPFSSYENSDGDTVTWELVEIFSIEPLEPKWPGDEVIGFIADTDELCDLAS